MAEKTLEERSRLYVEELKQLSTKHKLDVRAVISRYGPQIEVFDLTEKPKDDL